VHGLSGFAKIAFMKKQCFVHQFGTPICDAFAAVNAKGEVILFYFLGNREGAQVIAELEAKGYAPEWNEEAVGEVANQTAEYFAGKRKDFTLKLAPEGTRFQQHVWQELQRIPYGETISYGELATRVGNPKASRAVGAANGQNPIALIIPCHRVIGSDKSLTGYGGGLNIKEALLRHEGAAFRNAHEKEPSLFASAV
jgi:methylated-DNA-[protein]-cysteine S-methyltransferase